VFREPSILEPVIDFEMFLVWFGKPGEVEIPPILGLRVKVHHTKHVHEGFMLSGLSHVQLSKKLPQSRSGRKGMLILRH
jgi:hypothetical protein